MKTAKVHIASVELQCPYCEATIPSPGGSLFWEVAEMSKTEPTTHEVP